MLTQDQYNWLRPYLLSDLDTDYYRACAVPLGLENSSFRVPLRCGTGIVRRCTSTDEFTNTLKAAERGLTPDIIAKDEGLSCLLWNDWSKHTLNSFSPAHPEARTKLSNCLDDSSVRLSAIAGFRPAYNPCKAIDKLVRRLTARSPQQHQFIIQSLTSVLDSYSHDETTAVHGDLHGGNILVREENTNLAVRFIDFSFSGSGDPLWDRASLVFDAMTQRCTHVFPFSDVLSHKHPRWNRLVSLSGWLAYFWYRDEGHKRQELLCEATLLSLNKQWRTIFSALMND